MGMIATGLGLFFISGFAAAVGVFFLLRFTRSMRPSPSQLSPVNHDDIVYLFNGRNLLDATDRARSLLPSDQNGGDDLDRFLSVFGPRFTRLDQRLAMLDPETTQTIAEHPDDPKSMTLRTELHQGILRITITDPRHSEAADRYATQAMEAELDVLRSVAEMSPVLTWRQQQDGTVVWANTAYMAAVQKQLGEEALGSWPPGKLFPGLAPQAGDLAPGTPRRVSFTRSNDDSRRWFEFRAHPGPVNTLCFASPIDNLVQAETSLKEFIGTLGKTFAQLPIGLAIFDAQRHLVLFNPALVELTGLSAEVLTQRPTLHAFLDALRENQHIPEPRDYKNWRLRIAQLEAAATGGRHQETWTLPTGQTYRVTGQPHPNGAVAFLFEDISSEISLTRRFRAEIDMGVAVLNALNYGVAVFTRNGALQFCNGRYRELWGLDPEDSVSDISLEGSLHHWGLGTEQDDIGSKLQTFVFVGGKRSKFTFRVTACDGLPCIAEVSPLPQRASLVVFRPAQNTDCTVPLDTSQRKIAF